MWVWEFIASTWVWSTVSSPNLPANLPSAPLIFRVDCQDLTDSYVKYAASALSAASLGRNVFASFLPLASYELFLTLGYGWAGSLLGFVGLALSVVPVVLVIKGRQIRARSPFMREAGEEIAAYEQGEKEGSVVGP